MKIQDTFDSILKPIEGTITLNLSGQTEASSAEEQLARNNPIRLRTEKKYLQLKTKYEKTNCSNQYDT
ncbi:hypothetical protein L0222_17750 [bacterium]|nr:hypothetical protein [bacterium]MCI0607259.1 hypothetical protein [bacterium]